MELLKDVLSQERNAPVTILRLGREVGMGGLAKSTDSVRHRGRPPKRITVHANIRGHSGS